MTNTITDRTDFEQEIGFRRATEREIRIAREWVDQATADWPDTNDAADDRQAEYERALEIIIHANGGRQSKLRPPVVVLCGSTRFYKAFQEANLRETLAGRIVLSIGCDTKSDGDLFAAMADGRELGQIKTGLDELHKRKIDLADEVVVLNVDGYVGPSTRSEIEYAESLGKPVRYLEPVEVTA